MIKTEILVDEFTSPLPVVGHEKMLVKDALFLMDSKQIRHLPIVKNNKPVGIISQRDLSFISALEGGDDWEISQCMIEDPFCVRTGSSLDEVALEMSRKKIGSALVLSCEGTLDGIFTSTDGLNALIEVVRGDLEDVKEAV